MKILFATPGHLKTVPMDRFCVDALLALGHDVLRFDNRPSLSDKLSEKAGRFLGNPRAEEYAATNGKLRRFIEAEQPDLFLALFGFDISAETLRYLRAAGIPSACWWINDPFQFERSLKKAVHYDFVFSNSAGSVQAYRNAGVTNAFFLPTACDPAVHRPVAPKPEYASDVCFAGDWSPIREEFLGHLAKEFDVKIFGPWKKKLSSGSPLIKSHLQDGFFKPDEMACMFCSAKVVFNIHTWYGKFDHGVNPRLFEAAGCGAFQVVDWKQEIPRLFDCRKEVACYQTLEDLFDITRKALKGDAARNDAAAAAHATAYREHTYRHRMEKLLTLVEEARK